MEVGEAVRWKPDSGWSILVDITDNESPYSDMTDEDEPEQIGIEDLFELIGLSEPLRDKWKKVCNEYLEKFMRKHEYCEDINNIWVADDIGEIANIGDMFIAMNDIRYDLDNDVPEDYFEKWYWKRLDRYEMGIPYMNYASFCKGCPDPITSDQENEIIEARKRVDEAKKLLNDEIKNYEKQTGFQYKGF